MSDLLKTAKVSAQLQENLQVLNRLLGPEKWDEVRKLLRPSIRRLMDQAESNNPLAVVIPVAKRMSAAGEDPTTLIAVATEMCLEEEPQKAQEAQVPKVVNHGAADLQPLEVGGA